MAIAGFILNVVGGQHAAGLNMSRRAVAANPNSPIALMLCGTSEGLIGDLDRSEQCFERAIKLSPNAPDIFNAITQMGAVELMRGNDELAIEWCLRSLATFKEWPMTYWTLVPALALLGRVDEAKDALAKLLEIAPGTSMEDFTGDHPFAPRFVRYAEGFRIVGLKPHREAL
jgi:adenylate cyclase